MSVKERKLNRWNYEEADVREDVKTSLPDDWSLKVYKVRSGDSGETYWVQLLSSTAKNTFPIALCDCMNGKFSAPLSILGLRYFSCKHVQQLLAFLKNGDA